MRIIRSTLIILASSMLIIAACNRPVEMSGTTSSAIALSPSSPINVQLSISKLPILNEPVDLTCNVTSRTYAANSTAQIKLPKGASLVSGNLEWQGDLGANIPISFSARIVFKETGHQTIEATARHIVDDKNSWGDLDAFYLDIGSESSTFGWTASPVPVMRTDKYAVIKTDLDISHAPKLNEPAKLFITTVSPVDFLGLSVVILIEPKSAALSDSDSNLIAVPLVPGANQYAVEVTGVDLQANIPYHFSATVVFSEAGYYTVSAGARQKVNNVSYYGTQDSIQLKIGVRESTLE